MIKHLKTCVFLFMVCFLAFQTPAFAVTLKGTDGLVVHLSKVSDFGENKYLMKILGAQSAWDDKVFTVEETRRPTYTAYSFSYDIELSSGTKARSYTILTSSGSVLKEGSLLDRYELTLPEYKEALVLWLEPDAESSVNLLREEFEANPFKPDPNR